MELQPVPAVGRICDFGFSSLNLGGLRLPLPKPIAVSAHFPLPVRPGVPPLPGALVIFALEGVSLPVLIYLRRAGPFLGVAGFLPMAGKRCSGAGYFCATIAAVLC